MSDAIEIQKWMRSATDAVWDGFFGSLPKIMDTIGTRASNLLAQRGVVWAKPSDRKTSLVNAIKGIENYLDKTVNAETEMSITRDIKLPYGSLVEGGGDTKVTSGVINKMYALYQETLDKKYLYAFVSYKFGKKKGVGVIARQAKPFIQPILDMYDEESLARDVIPFVVDRVSRIPNMEVTLGNK